MPVESDNSAKLKEKLPKNIVKILEKYNLKSDKNHIWYTMKENSFIKKIVKQAFLERNDELATVFRINELCAAKLKYYRTNWDQYQPMKYSSQEGFIPVETWDMEFLMHIPSGTMIDLRELQRITDIEEFKEFCANIENLVNKDSHDGES